MPEDMQSILFLCSLPEELDNFVVAIEAQDVLPKLENLKVKILEVEHRRIDKVEKVENVFVAKHQSKYFKNSHNQTQNYERSDVNFRNICVKSILLLQT